MRNLLIALFLFTGSTILAADADDLAKAKQLTFDGEYDKSDKVLATYKGSQDNVYHLCMMINAYQNNNKALTDKHLKFLEDTFEPLPRRYEALVFLIRADIETWKTEDLKDISRDMTISGNRLKVHRGDDKTQLIQKEIVRKLDKQIKDLEDKASGKGDGSGKDKGKDDFAKMPGQGGPPMKPADESKVVGGAGAGRVDDRKLREAAENWGTLPPDRRQALVHEITRDLPPRYRMQIEDYFRSLSRLHNHKK